MDEGPVRAEAEQAVVRGTSYGGKERRPGAEYPKGATGTPPAAEATKGKGKVAFRPSSPASRNSRRRRAVSEVTKELAAEVGSSRALQLEGRLMEAASAFEAERYGEARKLLQPLIEKAPRAPAVRELYGLVLYHLKRWTAAVRELETFVGLTGSVEQHPVLADSYRALGRHARVAELWKELRAASPGAELVAEGRIVMAGSLADQGDVRGAIRLLEKAGAGVKRPRWHHLRLWYALADLYERAGELPRARDLFLRVANAEPSFADVAERLAALGRADHA
jgi:tetratricopeptide (TPR) repeat protein